jgi:hypothetical protein
VTAGPPGRAMAGMAAASGPSGLSQRRGLPGMASAAEHALEAAHSVALLPLPGMASEGVGSQAEDGVGPVVERVEGGGGGPCRRPGPRQGER